METRQRAVQHPAVQIRVPVVLKKLTLDGRLVHHASRCKRLVVDVGYVIGYIESDVAKPAAICSPNLMACRQSF
jgi:hypothetical protein